MNLTAKRKRYTALNRQLERLDQRLAYLEYWSNRYATIRLIIALVGILFISVLFFSRATNLFWIITIIIITLFTIIVIRHRQIKRQITKHQIWRKLKQQHVARMDLDWQNIPDRFISTQTPHFLDIDLDLHQLHRLLNTAITQEGGQQLYNWLHTQNPDEDTIQLRQKLVKELIPIVTFREKLSLHALNSDLPRQNIQWLYNWLADIGSVHHQTLFLKVLVGLASLNAILFLVVSAGNLFPIWTITWVVYVLLYVTQWRTIHNLFSESHTLAEALRQIKSVMTHIESWQYSRTPYLKRHCQPVLENQPSTILRRIKWTVSAASLQRNPLVWATLNAILPWDLYFIHRLNRQKQHLAVHLPQWLGVWFELEAIISLANFAYLNPHSTFPEITQQNAPVFAAHDLGHPLITDKTKVRNNFQLNKLGEIVIVTGSNMAGKSSFLRTIGVNLCLAFAGGVVDASSLSTNRFHLFSCIRVTDSIDDGISYFYAEVKRLKSLLEAVQKQNDLPVLFLIDEIFRGTNNRERLIGSHAYIQALVHKKTTGLIATHDLELTHLEKLHTGVHNYHFRESVVDGLMIFDYILRSGPCPTTNALKIMALEGLPVPENSQTES